MYLVIRSKEIPFPLIFFYLTISRHDAHRFSNQLQRLISSRRTVPFSLVSNYLRL